MKQNVGTVDRAIRMVIGLVFLALTYYVNPWWIILAAIFMLTSATGICMAYIPFGINTNK